MMVIEMNNNIHTLQSDSSTFASLLFDQVFPKNFMFILSIVTFVNICGNIFQSTDFKEMAKGAKEQFIILKHCNWSGHQNRGCGITLYCSIFNYVWQDGVHRLLDCKLALSKMIGNPRQIARTYQSLCTKVGKLVMILSKDPQII